MNNDTVLVKTDKGREALARRSPELGPRLRAMLILVDGQRSVTELDRLGAGLGGVALLEPLLANGWVAPRDLEPPFRESVAFSETRPGGHPLLPRSESSPRPDEASDSVEAASVPLPEARRLVVRFVNQQLGPMGDPLALRIEACQSVSDLLAQLPRARDQLRNCHHRDALQRFDQELGPLLPRA